MKTKRRPKLSSRTRSWQAQKIFTGTVNSSLARIIIKALRGSIRRNFLFAEKRS